MVGGEIMEDFFFPGRPKDLQPTDSVVGSQAKVNSQVILRKITAAAEHFAFLHQVSSKTFHSRIQSEAVALRSFQFETDPMISWAAFRPQYSGLALKIFNYHLELSVVEQIPDGHS